MKCTNHPLTFNWAPLTAILICGITLSWLFYVVDSKPADGTTPNIGWNYQEEIRVHGTIEDKYRVNDTRQFDIRVSDTEVVEVKNLDVNAYHNNKVGNTVTIVTQKPTLVLKKWPVVIISLVIIVSFIQSFLVSFIGAMSLAGAITFLTATNHPMWYPTLISIAVAVTIAHLLRTNGKYHAKVLNEILSDSGWEGSIHSVVLIGFVKNHGLCLGKRVWIQRAAVYYTQEDLSVSALRG